MEIAIHTPYIELGQVLKLADWAQSGGEAKMFIQNGEVLVNGEEETRRGKKLVPGDRVRFMEQELVIVASPSA